MKPAVIAMAFALTGCGLFGKGPNSPERETLNAGLVFSARAILAADKMCADVGRVLLLQEKVDEALAVTNTCSSTHRTALESLDLAQRALEVGDDSRTSCAVFKAIGVLESSIALSQKAGAKVPALVTDAVKFGKPIALLAGGGCQ